MRGGALLCGVALLAAGCGGGAPRQDEDEPEGVFQLEVVKSSFPASQELAKRTRMVVKVRNVGERTVPALNVTVEGFDRQLKAPGDPARNDPNVGDPERPVFLVTKSPNEFLRTRAEREDPTLVDQEVNPPAGGDNPRGGDTSFVGSYKVDDELAPGDTATFRWDVSAVQARPYEIRYEVNAGYDGKARAVTADGEPVTGAFRGVIEGDAPDARVASDGRTIVSGGRPEAPPPREPIVSVPGDPGPPANR